ncbi:MAG: DUF3836 domain-containing protein [Bacteroidales bacterium]|nr:DUF3836 domain-containing protein [Bacteroidales bacterium]
MKKFLLFSVTVCIGAVTWGAVNHDANPQLSEFESADMSGQQDELGQMPLTPLKSPVAYDLLLDSIVYTSQVTTFTYHDNGVVASEMTKKTDGSSQTYNQWDEEGRQTLTISLANGSGVAGVWDEGEKCEYVYDEWGNLTFDVTYLWSSEANDWVASSKNERTLDDNGIITNRIYYTWSSEANEWVLSKKYDWIYDDNGKLTLNISYIWTAETWVEGGKYEYGYDNNGNLTFQALYEWSTEANAWIGAQKKEWAYDDNGNRIYYASYEWSNETNDWKAFDKQDYTYDDKGNQIFRIYYTWSGETNAWEESYKYEYDYDDNGNKMCYVYFTWTSQTNDWAEYCKVEYDYDEYGNQTLYIFYDWSNEAKDWIGYDKREWAYDEYGNQILSVSYNWSAETNTWVGKVKYEYDYGDWADTPYAEYCCLTSSYSSSVDGSSWEWSFYYGYEGEFDEATLTYTIHYSSINFPAGYVSQINYFSKAPGSGIADATVKNTQIAVSGRTILTGGESISVYDLSGRLVGRSNGDALTIAQPGLYIVRTTFTSTKVIIR